MTGPLSDYAVWPKLVDLATCLCNELADSGLPAPCFCGVMPGASVALDYATNCGDNCGMAWVRAVSVFPSTNFPSLDTGFTRCNYPLAFTAEVGVIRCMEVPADGEPPSLASLLASAQLQLADMAAMRRAIVCCSTSGDVVLGAYTPTGPQGGVVGGSWLVSLPAD